MQRFQALGLHLGFPLMALTLAACGATHAPPRTQTNPSQHYDSLIPIPDFSNGGTDADDDPRIPTPPLPQRVQAATRGDLYCEPGQDCHPAVAMVSVVVRKGIERCTGFLIAPDLVMTNDHCIDKSTALKEYNGQCDNLIFAHFPGANGVAAESVSCGRIITRSRQTGLQSRDYAIIQLKSPVRNRMILPLSSRGFRDGESATIYRVQMRSDASRGSYDGVIVRTECKASYKTIVYPAVQSPQSPLMTFGNCPIQSGNSGSAVLNSDGQVGAIIQGYLTLKEDAKVQDQIQASLLEGSYGEVALGTQLACMPEISRVSNSCTPVLPIQGRYPKDYVAELGDFNASSRLPPLGSNERWRPLPAPTANSFVFIRTPVCVAPSRATSFQSSVTYFKRGLNESLQAEWRSVLKPGDKTVVFQSLGTSPDGTSVQFQNAEFGMLSIPACTRLASH